MDIKIRNELIPLNLLVFVLIVAIIFFPSNVLRIILGLPFILFFPGYVLMSALFPGKKGMDNIERVALSFGVSLLVVVLIALILNYTSWGIKVETILYATAFFIFATSIVSWLRRKKLPEKDRYSIEFHLAVPGWGEGMVNRVLFVIMVVVILGAVGTLGYIAATPRIVERFTEFYILGAGGEAIDYPNQLVVGKEGKVIIGIINREHETMSYRVEVRVNEVKNNAVESIVLEHDEKWEQKMSFVPQKAGINQKVEFLLYKNGDVEPALKPLHLWVDVIE